MEKSYPQLENKKFKNRLRGFFLFLFSVIFFIF